MFLSNKGDMLVFFDIDGFKFLFWIMFVNWNCYNGSRFSVDSLFCRFLFFLVIDSGFFRLFFVCILLNFIGFMSLIDLVGLFFVILNGIEIIEIEDDVFEEVYV